MEGIREETSSLCPLGVAHTAVARIARPPAGETRPRHRHRVVCGCGTYVKSDEGDLLRGHATTRGHYGWALEALRAEVARAQRAGKVYLLLTASDPFAAEIRPIGYGATHALVDAECVIPDRECDCEERKVKLAAVVESDEHRAARWIDDPSWYADY